MTATVTHTPKAGALLTGTEYESASHHSISISAADVGAAAAAHTHTHAATTGQTVDDHHARDHAAAHAVGGADPLMDATVPVTQAFGDAAAAGTATVAAKRDHKHGMPSERAAASTTPAAIGTGAVGTGTTDARADHVHATGAGTPVTQAFGDAAAIGTGPAASMTDHKHGMPANPTPAFATPAILLSTAAAAGAAGTVIRSDGTIAAFDATVPGALGAAAAGVINFAARRDHVHPTTGLALDPHGAAQHTDITRQLFLLAADAKLDSATAVNLGASPNLTGAVAYADAATQGAIWTFAIPADWASGVITVQPVWSPGATDGVAHTVRWSMTCKNVAAGTTITAAGTTVAFTGASSARTIAVIVKDTATSTTLTPAAANDLFTITLQRIGADAADTYVGVVNLLGILVSYTANQ